MNLTATRAPDAAAAAKIYPAIYWYSMLEIPPVSAFDGKGAIPEGITQQRWLGRRKNIGCHPLGQLSKSSSPCATGSTRSTTPTT